MQNHACFIPRECVETVLHVGLVIRERLVPLGATIAIITTDVVVVVEVVVEVVVAVEVGVVTQAVVMECLVLVQIVQQR